ncbi:unnamed protein product [marine sediment metagenome]|uniref:CpXC domain-containing protein n=1 Tax=marine sediment metagenome TaxID=412755 RepID=X0S4F9_9ZZZZ
MGTENAVCPRCGKEVLVTVPSGHRLWSIVENPQYDAAAHEDDETLATQMSRCSYCNSSFGAVTRDERL